MWYDALGEEGRRHRDEVEQFAAAAKGDGILFHGITYQELILILAATEREKHTAYIRYLTERYL